MYARLHTAWERVVTMPSDRAIRDGDPSAATSTRARKGGAAEFFRASRAWRIVQSPSLGENSSPPAGYSSTKFAPAFCAARAIFSSSTMRRIAITSGGLVASTELPMKPIPLGLKNPPTAAHLPRSSASICCRTPIRRKCSCAGEQTASPQILSRGKRWLSSSRTRTPCRAR
jgi:hypothetical protein